MRDTHLSKLKLVALLFLLPGLAGLIVSAMISSTYLDNLPRIPDATSMRLIPRNIHGTVIYQTGEEDRKLSLIEYSSVAVFMVGLGCSLVYLRKWGIARAIGADEPDSYYDET